LLHLKFYYYPPVLSENYISAVTKRERSSVVPLNRCQDFWDGLVIPLRKAQIMSVPRMKLSFWWEF